MTERISEKRFVTELFGREQSANNLGRKVAAAIYHSIFLHNPPHDPKITEGIKRNLSKLISADDLKLLINAHLEQEDHKLG